MPNKFANGLDMNMWRPLLGTAITHIAGSSMCSDKRNDISRNPFVYHLSSNTNLNRINIISKASHTIVNPALGGTFWAWVATQFAPSRAFEWNITTSGSSTTQIATTTVITAVGANMLANRGGSGERGFKIRVIGRTAGKVEERWIVGNTGGTTPTIWFDTPLSFSPVTWDTYEILWGAVYMLGATTVVSTSFRSFELSTNVLASLATTNLPSSVGTDSYMIALDEQYVPFNHIPWIGFVKGTFNYDTSDVLRVALSATAVAVWSITGQATGGDATLASNEYRNFQIRIVQDTVNTTAVGQRRIIASHTGGASPVYTLGSNWTVTPSTSAKYVIEYPNLILLRSTSTATLYIYNYNRENMANGTNTINANAWSTTYFGTVSGSVSAWCLIMPCFWIQPDPGKNARHSHIFFARWGWTSTIDLLDISGGTSWAWSSTIVYDGVNTMTTGTCGDYAPFDNEWKFFYLNNYVASAWHQMFRFDVKNRVMSPYCPTLELQSGTAAVWNRIATYPVWNGTEVYSSVLLNTHLTNRLYEAITLF